MNEFTFKDKKEWKISFHKDMGRFHGIPSETLAVVLLSNNPKHGYYFPILKKKGKRYIRWWQNPFRSYFLIQGGFFIPSNVKRHANRLLKLALFY